MSRAGSLARAFGADGTLNTSDVSGLGALAALNTVGTNQIDDSAITSAKIAAGAIPASDDASALTTGTLPNERLASGAAVANIGYTPVNKAGDNLTGMVTGKTNSSAIADNAYATQAGFQAYADGSANAFAGYAFHKSGSYGTFLYAKDHRNLALRGDNGTTTNILSDVNNDSFSTRTVRRSSGSGSRLEERIFAVTLSNDQSWVELFRWYNTPAYATAVGEIMATTTDWGCHGANLNHANFHLSAQTTGSYSDAPGQIRVIYRSSASNDGISYRIRSVSSTDIRFDARIQDDAGGIIDCSTSATPTFYVRLFVIDGSITWNYS